MLSEIFPSGGKQQHKHGVLVWSVCCPLGVSVTSPLCSRAPGTTLQTRSSTLLCIQANDLEKASAQIHEWLMSEMFVFFYTRY